jgi:hypothetical protein
VHAPVVPQVPPQVVPAPLQSLFVQQDALGMQAVPHILNPVAQG